MFHPLVLVVASTLERSLLLPLHLVRALALELLLLDVLGRLVLIHTRVLHLVDPRTVLVNWCLSQLVADLTNDWKKSYFDFHCYPLTAF